MMPSEPILTPRLRLRTFADDLSDLDELHAIQSDPEHMRLYPHPFSRDESRAWIERAFVREAMGWTFPWYSSAGSDFNFDNRVSFTPDELSAVRSNTTACRPGWSGTEARGSAS